MSNSQQQRRQKRGEELIDLVVKDDGDIAIDLILPDEIVLDLIDPDKTKDKLKRQ